MGSHENMDQFTLARMNTSSGSANYAHSTVKSAFRHTQRLEDYWYSTRSEVSSEESNPSEIEYIEILLKLIGQARPSIIDKKRLVEIFRYFAAAVYYSGAIVYSVMDKSTSGDTNLDVSENEADTSVLIEPTKSEPKEVTIFSELAREVSLEVLNKIAAKIVDKINSTPGIRDPFVKAKASSVGQIPFLQVSSTDHFHVLLRTGFELARSQRSTARQVKTGNEEIDHFPVLIYRSEHPNPNCKIPETLHEIIPDKKTREELLKGKWITWVHIFLSDYESTKTQVEIDLIEYPVVADPRLLHIPQEKMFDIVGRERSKWNARSPNVYLQEDLVVSYFSTTLFDYWLERKLGPTYLKLGFQDKTRIWQQMQEWCDSCIKNYATNLFKVKMYVGFSWGTIMDGGYGDKTTVCGSRNLLLLSLARGLVRLAQHSSKITDFMTRESIEHFEGLSTHIHKNCTRFMYNFGVSNRLSLAIIRSRERIQKKMAKTEGLVYRNKIRSYNCSTNSEGITVKSKPRGFVIVVILIGVLVFVAYCIGFGLRQKDADNWEEYISGMMSLPPLLAGICLFVIKFKFPKWEIMDIVNGRMFTEGFEDLVNVLPSGKKGAISIVASIDDPKYVLTGKGSNAFVINGEGEFEIDDLLTVRELQEAGFLFGVDYEGKPLAVNGQGVSRRIQFPENYDKEQFKFDQNRGTHYFYEMEDEEQSFEFEDDEIDNATNYDKNALKMLGEHEIQPAILYKIPVADMFVR